MCTEIGTSAELCDALQGCVACHRHALKWVNIPHHEFALRSLIASLRVRDDSVTCANCEKTWHLNCLDPPLSKKPALGWGWTCIKCTMLTVQDDEDEDSADNNLLGSTSDRNTTRAAGAAVAAAAKAGRSRGGFKRKRDYKGKGTAVQGQLDVSQWKMTHGWPYRYLGQNVDMASVLGKRCGADICSPLWTQ